MLLRSTYRRCRFWQKKIIFSDEAHFDLSRYVNKQHCRICGTENGFWTRGIIGLFCFENEQGETVTVNSDCYRAMLNEFFFTKIEEEDIGNVWFQQDGATCHTAESYTLCFAPCFSRSHYQPQSWCCLATSKLRFDTVGLLFVGYRQRYFQIKKEIWENIQ